MAKGIIERIKLMPAFDLVIQITEKEVARCQGNVPCVEKDKFPETMFHIQTDTPEGSGTRIYRPLE
jgi:hypothetical protein